MGFFHFPCRTMRVYKKRLTWIERLFRGDGIKLSIYYRPVGPSFGVTAKTTVLVKNYPTKNAFEKVVAQKSKELEKLANEMLAYMKTKAGMSSMEKLKNAHGWSEPNSKPIVPKGVYMKTFWIPMPDRAGE